MPPLHEWVGAAVALIGAPACWYALALLVSP